MKCFLILQVYVAMTSALFPNIFSNVLNLFFPSEHTNSAIHATENTVRTATLPILSMPDKLVTSVSAVKTKKKRKEKNRLVIKGNSKSTFTTLPPEIFLQKEFKLNSNIKMNRQLKRQVDPKQVIAPPPNTLIPPSKEPVVPFRLSPRKQQVFKDYGGILSLQDLPLEDYEGLEFVPTLRSRPKPVPADPSSETFENHEAEGQIESERAPKISNEEDYDVETQTIYLPEGQDGRIQKLFGGVSSGDAVDYDAEYDVQLHHQQKDDEVLPELPENYIFPLRTKKSVQVVYLDPDQLSYEHGRSRPAYRPNLSLESEFEDENDKTLIYVVGRKRQGLGGGRYINGGGYGRFPGHGYLYPRQNYLPPRGYSYPKPSKPYLPPLNNTYLPAKTTTQAPITTTTGEMEEIILSAAQTEAPTTTAVPDEGEEAVLPGDQNPTTTTTPAPKYLPPPPPPTYLPTPKPAGANETEEQILPGGYVPKGAIDSYFPLLPPVVNGVGGYLYPPATRPTYGSEPSPYFVIEYGKPDPPYGHDYDDDCEDGGRDDKECEWMSDEEESEEDQSQGYLESYGEKDSHLYIEPEPDWQADTEPVGDYEEDGWKRVWKRPTHIIRHKKPSGWYGVGRKHYGWQTGGKPKRGGNGWRRRKNKKGHRYQKTHKYGTSSIDGDEYKQSDRKSWGWRRKVNSQRGYPKEFNDPTVTEVHLSHKERKESWVENEEPKYFKTEYKEAPRHYTIFPDNHQNKDSYYNSNKKRNSRKPLEDTLVHSLYNDREEISSKPGKVAYGDPSHKVGVGKNWFQQYAHNDEFYSNKFDYWPSKEHSLPDSQNPILMSSGQRGQFKSSKLNSFNRFGRKSNKSPQKLENPQGKHREHENIENILPKYKPQLTKFKKESENYRDSNFGGNDFRDSARTHDFDSRVSSPNYHGEGEDHGSRDSSPNYNHDSRDSSPNYDHDSRDSSPNYNHDSRDSSRNYDHDSRDSSPNYNHVHQEDPFPNYDHGKDGSLQNCDHNSPDILDNYDHGPLSNNDNKDSHDPPRNYNHNARELSGDYGQGLKDFTANYPLKSYRQNFLQSPDYDNNFDISDSLRNHASETQRSPQKYDQISRNPTRNFVHDLSDSKKQYDPDSPYSSINYDRDSSHTPGDDDHDFADSSGSYSQSVSSNVKKEVKSEEPSSSLSPEHKPMPTTPSLPPSPVSPTPVHYLQSIFDYAKAYQSTYNIEGIEYLNTGPKVDKANEEQDPHYHIETIASLGGI